MTGAVSNSSSLCYTLFAFLLLLLLSIFLFRSEKIEPLVFLVLFISLFFFNPWSTEVRSREHETLCATLITLAAV